MDLNAYLQDLEYLVNIDSGWDAPEGQTEIASFFRSRFDDLGWLTQLHDLQGPCGPCLVCRNREADRYDVMLIGHTDTVFAKGTAAERPFRKDDKRAYGPGVLDMKQGSLLIYYILKELAQTDLNILAVFNPDEEIGSIYSKPLTTALAATTDYILVYEGASADGAHCSCRKGRLAMTVDFTGKACHCGYVFQNDARSAISEMARWIVTLDGLQSREEDTSVNIGVVSGGTGINTVAEHASMQVDVRFARNSAPQRIDEAIDYLLQHAAHNGIQVTFRQRSLTPALEQTTKGSVFVSRVRELANSLGQVFIDRLRGGISDANYLAQQGAVCLDALGPGGDDDHTADEYLNLDSILPAQALSLAVLQDLEAEKAKNL